MVQTENHEISFEDAGGLEDSLKNIIYKQDTSLQQRKQVKYI